MNTGAKIMNRIKKIVIAILSCCLVLGSIVFCKKSISKGNEIIELSERQLIEKNI